MSNTITKLILTSGEPAGIGPDLILAAGDHWDAHLIAVGNRALLAKRAATLGLCVEFLPYNSTTQHNVTKSAGYPSSISHFTLPAPRARPIPEMPPTCWRNWIWQ